MDALSGVHAKTTDDVDTLVEAVIEDPSRAEDIKAALRQHFSMPHVIALDASPLPKRDEVSEDESGDLWDNVPV